MPASSGPSPQTLAWAAAQVRPGARVERCERLTGGITAAVDRLVVAGRAVVLKRWPGPADVATDPDTDAADTVAREAAALLALAGSDVPAPRLLGVDATGADSGARCLLMSHVAGDVELAPVDVDASLRPLARAQASIHALPPVLTAPQDGLWNPRRGLPWIADAGLRRDARAAAECPPGDPAFVHGDYQPFNVLWDAGRVSGVVDWSAAGTGWRGVDVGHCRLNRTVLFSPDVADAYLAAYAAAGGPPDPHGDVRGLLTFSADWYDFLPRQVAGRSALDLTGMRARVVETVRRAVLRL